MDFLKNLFGVGGGGPQVLPGAQAPPSKGSDIANVLARVLGAAGAGVNAAGGQPQQAPPWLSALRGRQQPGLGMGMGMGGGMGGTPRDETISGLLHRIFGQTNSPMRAQPPMTGQIPTTPDKIGTGTGGLY
jgi:hypothetical protein